MRSVAVALALCLSLSGFADAKERAEISVPFRVVPYEPLPHGLQAVAVVPAEVHADEADASRREEKWSAYAADIIDEMLTNASFEGGPDAPKLKVVSRRELTSVLKEHDLAAAGIVGTETAQQIGQILSVQGLILSRIHIDMTEEETRSRRADWGRILGGIVGGSAGDDDARDDHPGGGRSPVLRRMYRSRNGGGGRGPGFDEDEVTEISRHLSVRCSFQLIDAVTGEKYYVHNPPPFRKTDTASPIFMFGTVIHQEELNPVDHFIGELVEKAALEFVGKLVPVTGETKVSVVGRGKNGEAGVRALRRGDAESARQLLKQAIIDDPDDHENIFALGVAFELLDRPKNALYCYRRAAGHEKANDEEAAMYMAARDRVAAYLNGAATEADPDAPSDEPDVDDADEEGGESDADKPVDDDGREEHESGDDDD